MNNLQQYDDLASQWWNENSPFKDLLHLNEPRFRFFESCFSEWQGKSVLDLGCGGGFVSEELARRGACVVGVDPASALVEVAKNHARESKLEIDYRVGTGEAIPAADASFDVVVCVDVLEHVADLDKVLKEVHRVLKPGGLFLYDTINKTLFSFLWMILLLEWVAGRIPRGTHDWFKFIKPKVLTEKLAQLGFSETNQKGIVLSGIRFEGWGIVPSFGISARKKRGLYVGVARKK
jgi:2-polyprenyl-6-hydroxyphenyl methylase/3-demethylubiquinone-9 3-methyltransferase